MATETNIKINRRRRAGFRIPSQHKYKSCIERWTKYIRYSNCATTVAFQ